MKELWTGLDWTGLAREWSTVWEGGKGGAGGVCHGEEAGSDRGMIQYIGCVVPGVNGGTGSKWFTGSRCKEMREL